MMKWPEKKQDTFFYKENVIHNDAIDACRTALNEACRREELAKIIYETFYPKTLTGTSFEDIIAMDKTVKSNFEDASNVDLEKAYDVADSIRCYLGLEDRKGE